MYKRMLYITFLILASMVWPGIAGAADGRNVDTGFHLASDQDELDPWGLEVVAIRLTAANYMLDFRYRFSDFERASEVVNRQTRPYLIVERNGAKLHVPVSQKLGPLRQAQNHMKPDRTYFMFFANPGRMVTRGDKVTLVMGDFQQQHIVVE